MLQAENLTKIFMSGDQKIVALNDLTFTVPEGQFLTITGRSGSGKSTLLYQLGLLDLPTSGKVLIDGRDLVPVPENERTATRLNELGYIFQDYAILPSLTALENTVLPLLMQGYSSADAEAKAKKANAQVQTKIVTKIIKIHDKARVVKERIEQNKAVINRDCKLSDEAISIYNSSITKEKK